MANTYNIPTVENATFEEKLDNVTLMLAAIADGFSETADGSGLYFRNFKTLQQLNRMGLAKRVLDSYSYIIVNKETSVTVAVHGTGITAATVDDKIFVEKVGTAETKEYEFIHDGSAWHLGNDPVQIAEYGITVTGTAHESDTIVIDESAEAVRYDVLDIDYDVPSDPNFDHTITLCRHDCVGYNSLQYKRPQGLVYVDPAVFPNGLTAGQLYYVVGDCCCYDNTNKEDGLYGLIPSVNVPAGGLLRHSATGSYMSDASAYTKARVLAGTWTSYDTIDNGRVQLEAGIATVEADGTTGTSLGTVTAEIPSKRITEYCNLTRRNAYGSNDYIHSDERQWMNSRAQKGTTAKGVYLWQDGALGKFDLPSTYNAAGNLYGVDPQLLDVIGAVRKRTYLAPVDRSDQDIKYVDSDETVFSLSMLEAGLGTTNDGVYESAVDRDGNPKTVPYAYYARRTTAAERIKYQGGAARTWFLRSPDPSYCYGVRHCHSSGSLSYYSANYGYGCVDAYNIV